MGNAPKVRTRETTFLFLFLILGSLYVLFGCSTVRQQSDVNAPPFTYKADLQITVNGRTFDGLAVTALQDKVDVQVSSPIPADRLQITSCNRNDVFENVKVPFTYSYSPSPIESQGMCVLNIELFSKSALTAWGMVAFKSDETLHAHSYYNADGYQWTGFSVGQSKAGLDQSLEFPVPVDKYIGEDNCHLTTTDRKMFMLRPGRGVCRMSFKLKDAYHRSLFIGYDQVLIRQ
jgi:hypothetical protein